MDSKLIWYTARASGLVTWALLAASVLWGLALSSRLLRNRPRQAWLLDLHRFLAASAVAFLAIHVTSIVLDTYVHFGVVEVLVPFTGSWHPGAVAWGIAGLYLLPPSRSRPFCGHACRNGCGAPPTSSASPSSQWQPCTASRPAPTATPSPCRRV